MSDITYSYQNEQADAVPNHSVDFSDSHDDDAVKNQAEQLSVPEQVTAAQPQPAVQNDFTPDQAKQSTNLIDASNQQKTAADIANGNRFEQSTTDVVLKPLNGSDVSEGADSETMDSSNTIDAHAAVDIEPSTEEEELYNPTTLNLAARDVCNVMDEQKEQSYAMTTKLNILFVANGALLTSLSISGLMTQPCPFSLVFNLGEVIGFFASFSLLIRAFLPRQFFVSPNLQGRRFLEHYLELSPEDYQLQMLVNRMEAYNANKQRIDDISQSLRYSAYSTWGVAAIMLTHMITVASTNVPVDQVMPLP